MKLTTMVNLIVLSLSMGCAAAAPLSHEQELINNNRFTQSVYVANLLGNPNITDAGMTGTSIVVQYFTSNSYPCWTSTLGYQEEVTIHAGPTQGCKTKVNKVVIIPIVMGDKLKTYEGPVSTDIDVSKFSSQIVVMQDQPPFFDENTGLVAKSGTIKLQVQSQQ
jgi:hypothetical protein